MSLLLVVGAAAAAGGPDRGTGPSRTQPRRESGRERGGDKPYESRKRGAGRGEGGKGVESGKRWCDGGVAMAMLDSDAIWGCGGAEGGSRFDSTVYQRYSFSSLSLSLSFPALLSPSLSL